MDKLDGMKASFGEQLDRAAQAHQQQTEAELEPLVETLRKLAVPELPADVQRRLADFDRRAEQYFGRPAQLSRLETPRPAQVRLDDKHELRLLDDEFLKHFRLAEFGFPNRLAYPTVYCETAEEFYGQSLQFINQSPWVIQMNLLEEIKQAKAAAAQGRGALGVNWPGDGCYINGWLFGFLNRCSPQAAWEHPQLRTQILETVVHEKLGHGFLTEYSQLGRLNKQVGLDLARLAQEFGIRPAEDPLAQLRHYQRAILFTSSKLLEEGWSRWIETRLPAVAWGAQPASPISLELFFNQVAALEEKTPKGRAAKERLLPCLFALFTPEPLPIAVIFEAMKQVEDIDSNFEEYFAEKPALALPLRYLVGEMLFQQAEQNQGALCQPYLALIAANVSFDLERLGVNDLETVIRNEARYHPDARLAILSRVSLAQPGDVAGLVQAAHQQLSFSIPDELKSLG